MNEVKKLLKEAWGEFWRYVGRSVQMFFLWVGFKIYPDNWDQSLESVRREAIEGILNMADQALSERVSDLDHVFSVTLRKPYGDWKTDQRFTALLMEINQYRAMKKQKEIKLP